MVQTARAIRFWYIALRQRFDPEISSRRSSAEISEGVKGKVANDFEVQDPRSPAHWSAIIADCGRVFRPLDDAKNTPGKEYVSMYFPPTPTGKSATRDVLGT